MKIQLIAMAVTLWSSALFSQQTTPTCFPCDGKFYMTNGDLSNGSVNISTFDSITADTLARIASSNSKLLNIMAFNYSDNYIYTVDYSTYEVFRLDNTGDLISLGIIDGLDEVDNMNGGDFDENGVLVINGTSPLTQIYRIDVTTNPPSILSSATRHYAATSTVSPSFADIAYNRKDGKFYGLDYRTSQISTIDPVSGLVTPVSTSIAGVADVFGATFFGANYKYLYGYGRAATDTVSNTLYRCDIATGQCTVVQTGVDPQGNMDGCSCHEVKGLQTIDCTGTVSTSFEDQSDPPTIFPNPASGLVRINNISGGTSYQVLAMDGRMLLSGISLAAQVELDLSGLQAGIYRVVLSDGVEVRVMEPLMVVSQD